MAFLNFFAKHGAVGGTARFIGRVYNAEVKSGRVEPGNCLSMRQLRDETYVIVRSALLARFNNNINHPHLNLIHNLLLDFRENAWDDEGKFDDVPYSLLNLVEAILSIEANYHKSTASDLKSYRDIIVAELTKCGVPEKYIFGRLM